MLPILLCSIVAVGISAERLIFLNTDKISPPHLLAKVWKQLKNNEMDAQKLRNLLARARKGYQVLAIHTGGPQEEAGLEAWLSAWQLTDLPVTADPTGAIRRPWDLDRGDCALLQHGCVTWRGSMPSRSPRISTCNHLAA